MAKKIWIFLSKFGLEKWKQNGKEGAPLGSIGKWFINYYILKLFLCYRDQPHKV